MNDWGEAALAARADGRSRRLTAMLAVLFVFGCLTLFLRASLGVVGPDLARDMHLDPARLSLVASSFFFAYAVMQIPTGMLLDRLGARVTLAGMLLFTAAGSALFATASSTGQLTLGRVLMGLGSAGVFTGSFHVLAAWLPQAAVVQRMGVLNSFAATGTLAATTPLAALIAVIGWRESYLLFAGAVVVLLVSIWLIVRDAPAGAAAHASRSESFFDVIRGAGEAIRQPGMPRLLLTGFPISASSTITGVWGAPYLRDAFALTSIERGNVLLVMAFSAIAGHSALAWAARRTNSTRRCALAGMLGVLAGTSALAILDHPPVVAVAAIFCVIGLFSAIPMLVFAHARGLVPPHLMGRGLSAANTGVMLAIALMQLAFGWIVGALTPAGAPSPEIAYRAGFALQAATALIALLVYWPIRDVRPRG